MIDYNSMSYAEGRALLKQADGEYAKQLLGEGLEKLKSYAGQAVGKAKELYGQGKAWASRTNVPGGNMPVDEAVHGYWLRNPLVGAAAGGAIGLGSSALQRKGRRTPWSRMLTGAMLGGAAGVGNNLLHDVSMSGQSKLDAAVTKERTERALHLKSQAQQAADTQNSITNYPVVSDGLGPHLAPHRDGASRIPNVGTNADMVERVSATKPAMKTVDDAGNDVSNIEAVRGEVHRVPDTKHDDIAGALGGDSDLAAAGHGLAALPGAAWDDYSRSVGRVANHLLDGQSPVSFKDYVKPTLAAAGAAVPFVAKGAYDPLNIGRWTAAQRAQGGGARLAAAITEDPGLLNKLKTPFLNRPTAGAVQGVLGETGSKDLQFIMRQLSARDPNMTPARAIEHILNKSNYDDLLSLKGVKDEMVKALPLAKLDRMKQWVPSTVSQTAHSGALAVAPYMIDSLTNSMRGAPNPDDVQARRMLEEENREANQTLSR